MNTILAPRALYSECPHCGHRLKINISSFDRPVASRWAGVDWTRTTHDIAREMGVSVSAVSGARKRYAPGTVSPMTIDPKWSLVDWSKASSTIADEMKVGPAQVSTMRRRLAPETIDAARAPWGSRIRRTPDPTGWWTTADWSLTDIELALKVGRSRQAVWRMRRTLAARREGAHVPAI
jgi:hypothetical protein